MNMNEMISFKLDGKRKKMILLGSFFSSCLMVYIMVVSIFATPPKPSHISIFSRVSTISPCAQTLYPQVCESLILSTNDDTTPTTTMGDMFNLSLKFSIEQAQLIRSFAYNISHTTQKPNTNSFTVFDDCVDLLDHSLHQLAKIQDNQKPTPSPEDIQTWLSSSITHQTTCLDALQSQKFSTQKSAIGADLQNNIQHISNSLALHQSIVTEAKSLKVGGGGRKLLSDDFPSWVLPGERKLLETSVEAIEANAVVATDGTGTHKSVAEALAFVSLAETGSGRTVIHVKAGTYHENNLKIPVQRSNILLVGDGKGKTVITGSKSVGGGGSTTFNSATLGVEGDGFMARDITFENTAGPDKGQAVALRVSSDKSVFYRCSILGYQDTLYTLSNRQFYRETDIYGTVDFIFGNSAAVFQSCNIVGRSRSRQKVYITAQGRSDPNQNTGISIHKCRITSDNHPTYLGRPWKKYSRTVIMQSYLDGSIDSEGWFPWNGFHNTVYYGEYMNSGPGSSTSGRVNWPGYHASLSSTEASKFTVANLISGNSWLPSTGVVFDSGL